MKIESMAGNATLHAQPEEGAVSAKAGQAQQASKTAQNDSAVKRPEKKSSTVSRSGDTLFISADGLRQMLDKLHEKTDSMQIDAQGTAFESQSGDNDVETNPKLLTQRLVSAQSPLELREVIGLSNKALVKLRIALASASGDAKDEIEKKIRKFEKLLQRAYRKIDDLKNEDVKRVGAQVAKEKKELQKAERLKAELREMIKKRKKREEKYLREKDEKPQDDLFKLKAIGGSVSAQDKLDAATEAQIEAQVRIIMAADSAASGAGGADADISVGGAAATAEEPGAPVSFEDAEVVSETGEVESAPAE